MKAKTVGCQKTAVYFHMTNRGANLEESKITFLLLLQKKLKRRILNLTDLKQNVPAACMEGTRPRNLTIKESFAKFSVLNKPLLKVKLTGLLTSTLPLPSPPPYDYRPTFNSIPSSQWYCPPSIMR